MSFYALDTYTATEGQTDFTISFPYLDETHIVVSLNGTTLTYETQWSLANSTTVRLSTATEENDIVVIRRSTSPSARLVNWSTGGVITESDLDLDSYQAFFLAQEALDSATLTLGVGDEGGWDAEGNRIINVGTPSESTDAATKAYVDAIAVGAGNVPTPGDPGDDGKVLKADSGTFSWSDSISYQLIDADQDVEGFLGSEDVSDMRTNLSLGTAALYDTGTGWHNIPLLDTDGELPSGIKGSYLDLSGSTSIMCWIPLEQGNISSSFQYTDIENDDFANYDVLLIHLYYAPNTAQDALRMLWKIGSSWVTSGYDYVFARRSVSTWAYSEDTNAAQITFGSTVLDDDFGFYEIKIMNGSGWPTTNTIPRGTALGHFRDDAGNEAGMLVGAFDGGNGGTTGGITGLRFGTDQTSRYPKSGSKYRIWGLHSGF